MQDKAESANLNFSVPKLLKQFLLNVVPGASAKNC
jgi:hypothetical protein